MECYLTALQTFKKAPMHTFIYVHARPSTMFQQIVARLHKQIIYKVEFLPRVRGRL
jgi:hypothetical protein